MTTWSGLLARFAPLSWILAVGLAAAGQWVLATGVLSGGWVTLCFVAAAVVAARAWGEATLFLASRAAPSPPPRLWLLLLTAPATMGSWLGAANNTFTVWGVGSWIASILLWFAGWRVIRLSFAPRQVVEIGARRSFFVLVVTILLVAALFRFWNINTLPREMTSDHAEKLLDVQDLLEGQRPIFFIRNTGREPMQFYVTALLAGPLGLGLSHLALKVGTAAISLVTVPLLYGVARWGLGLSRAASLLAMAFLAVSKWHVSISRVGLRFPYAPFGVALTLLFFFRALRLGERRDWLLAGASMGVALYGYTPVRVLPLLLAVGGGLYLLEQARGRTGQRWREALANVLLAPLTTLIVFVPLLRYSLEAPGRFWYRSATRLSGGLDQSPLAALLYNIHNAALMFHVRGDEVWVNSLQYDPFLDRITGLFLVLGLGVLVWNTLRRGHALEATLLLALPVLVLPSVLALAWPRENPSVVRASGALPVVMIIAALPLEGMLRAFRRSPWNPLSWSPAPARRLLEASAVTVLALSLAVVFLLNARVYFGPYARQYDRESMNSIEVANVILEYADQIGGVDHAYIRSWPYWLDHRTVAFSMGYPQWDSVVLNNEFITNPQSLQEEARLVILNPNDVRSRILLEYFWEGAVIRRYRSAHPGKDFLIVLHPDYLQP